MSFNHPMNLNYQQYSWVEEIRFGYLPDPCGYIDNVLQYDWGPIGFDDAGPIEFIVAAYEEPYEVSP